MVKKNFFLALALNFWTFELSIKNFFLVEARKRKKSCREEANDRSVEQEKLNTVPRENAHSLT